jgi:hypothetical protein
VRSTRIALAPPSTRSCTGSCASISPRSSKCHRHPWRRSSSGRGPSR